MHANSAWRRAIPLLIAQNISAVLYRTVDVDTMFCYTIQVTLLDAEAVAPVFHPSFHVLKYYCFLLVIAGVYFELNV